MKALGGTVFMKSWKVDIILKKIEIHYMQNKSTENSFSRLKRYLEPERSSQQLDINQLESIRTIRLLGMSQESDLGIRSLLPIVYVIRILNKIIEINKEDKISFHVEVFCPVFANAYCNQIDLNLNINAAGKYFEMLQKYVSTFFPEIFKLINFKLVFDDEYNLIDIENNISLRVKNLLSSTTIKELDNLSRKHSAYKVYEERMTKSITYFLTHYFNYKYLDATLEVSSLLILPSSEKKFINMLQKEYAKVSMVYGDFRRISQYSIQYMKQIHSAHYYLHPGEFTLEEISTQGISKKAIFRRENLNDSAKKEIYMAFSEICDNIGGYAKMDTLKKKVINHYHAI